MKSLRLFFKIGANVLLSLTFIVRYAHAQNLIYDPGFESGDETFCGVMSANAFGNNLIGWTSPTQGTPQLFFTSLSSECWNAQPTSTYTGPIGIKGSQVPLQGESMAGIYTYTIPDFNQRHYIQTAFWPPLIPGQAYDVGFYASLADNMEFSSNGLGAFLSEGAINGDSDGVLAATPQVQSEDILNDYTRWTLISNTIIAEAAYDHITIGNFQTDLNTELQTNPAQTGTVGTYGAFYFIDNVFIQPASSAVVDSPNPSEFWNVQPTFSGLTIVSLQNNQRFTAKLFDTSGRLVFQSEEALQLEIPWSSWSGKCAVIRIQGEREHFNKRICRPH